MIAKKATQKLLSIDWLQIFGGWTKPLQGNDSIRYGTDHVIIVRDCGSRAFRHIADITLIEKGIELPKFAVIQYKPYSSILRPDLAIIQISNKYLYQPDLIKRVYKLFKLIGFEHAGISRIDLALDLLQFDNGQYPQEMIEDYAERKARRIGKSQGQLSFRQKGNGLEYNAVTWGSHASDVEVQLYDKSREFAEKIRKPYIEKLWVDTLGTTKDVWRLELRIKNKGLLFCDKKDGELFNRELFNVLANYKELYLILLRKFFRFVDPRTDSNVSRQKPIEYITEATRITYDRKVIKSLQPSNVRYIKGVINMVNRLADSLSAIDEESDRNKLHYLYHSLESRLIRQGGEVIRKKLALNAVEDYLENYQDLCTINNDEDLAMIREQETLAAKAAKARAEQRALRERVGIMPGTSTWLGVDFGISDNDLIYSPSDPVPY